MASEHFIYCAHKLGKHRLHPRTVQPRPEARLFPEGISFLPTHHPFFLIWFPVWGFKTSRSKAIGLELAALLLRFLTWVEIDRRNSEMKELHFVQVYLLWCTFRLDRWLCSDEAGREHRPKENNPFKTHTSTFQEAVHTCTIWGGIYTVHWTIKCYRAPTTRAESQSHTHTHVASLMRHSL